MLDGSVLLGFPRLVRPFACCESNATGDNVAPTIELTGDAEVDEDEEYTLTLGTVTDPGDDTVTQYIVHWDGTHTDTYMSAGAVTHTYSGPDTHTIIVDLVDEV